MNDHRFLLEVAKALAGCQAIELELKAYISHAFRNIDMVLRSYKSNPPSPIAKFDAPFNFHGDDYKNSSLEQLIKVFQKLSDNVDLVKRLNQFKDKRNALAHKAIAQCMDEEGRLDEWKTASAYNDINTVQRDAETLLNDLFQEHSKRFVIYSGIPIPPARPGDPDYEG
jgi:hypothetical protein